MTWRETCPNATLSIINLTLTGLSTNAGLGGGRPATDRLSHGILLSDLVKLRAQQADITAKEKKGFR